MGNEQYTIERVGVSADELAYSRDALARIVNDLNYQCQTLWASGAVIAGNLRSAFHYRKPWFTYPTETAVMLGDTPEVRYLVARRQLRVLEAGLPLSPDDHAIVQFWPHGLHREGSTILGHFWDRLAKAHGRIEELDELSIPEAGTVTAIIYKPSAIAKAWKAQHQKPAEGPIWRQIPKQVPRDISKEVDERERQIDELIEHMDRRLGRGMPSDPILDSDVAALLRENAKYKSWAAPDDARVQELKADYDLFTKRATAAEELGVVLAEPEGLQTLLRECDETREMTREMEVTFRKLGREDRPTPIRFHWKFPTFASKGALFLIRFNEEDGPLGSRFLPPNAIPIRARIAPEKAVLEWKAMKESLDL